MLGAVLAVVGLVLGALWLGQRRLIYFPGGPAAAISGVLPGWSDVRLTTSDGLDLGAWYVAPRQGRSVIVVFNGNGGNREGRLPLAARLADAGNGVLLFDYRGYGGNPGTPTEQGLAQDARAAAGFVNATAPGHPVVYLGESLGAAVAIELALEMSPAAMILRSPFTSLADVAHFHYPYLPTRALLREAYPSIDRIRRVATPVLIVAGAADSTVPLQQSLQIYETAQAPKHLHVIDGADHNDSALLDGSEMIDVVVDFVDRYAPS